MGMMYMKSLQVILPERAVPRVKICGANPCLLPRACCAYDRTYENRRSENLLEHGPAAMRARD